MRVKRGNRGSLYIEFLIAVFVVAIGSAGIISLLSASSQASKGNLYYTVASQIAREEIENIRSTKACLLSNRTSASLISNTSALTQLPSGAGTLTIEDSSTLTGAKDITVTITWVQPSDKRTKTLTYKTMVSPYGPTS